MKIALIGSRVGYIDRGFESFTRNLFDGLKDELDITLFKGAGPRLANEVVVPAFRIENGILSKLGVSFRWREMIQERTYALGMLPWLIRNRYDVIHFSEVMLGRALLHLRRIFGFKYKLVFSNGAPAPPEFYACFDLTQEVTGVRYEDALEYGISEERLRLVPYAIDCDRFSSVEPVAKATLRQKYGIPEDKFVVVSVAAIKKHHKRIDVLIDEMACLDPEKFFLLVAGHRTNETPELEAQARRQLGESFRFVTVPHNDVQEMYQLADLFALCSLTEGLGIVILEAMSAGLPVLVHNDRSFRWVVGDGDGLVDMAEAGALANEIAQLAALPNDQLGQNLSEKTRRRFDWACLMKRYINLYNDAIAVD